MDSWGLRCLFIQVKRAHRTCLALWHAGCAAWYFLGAAQLQQRAQPAPQCSRRAAEVIWRAGMAWALQKEYFGLIPLFLNAYFCSPNEMF